jgi:amino acid permease
LPRAVRRRRTLGPRAAFVPALASLLLCFTAGVSCATVIADTATDLLAGLSAVDYELLPRQFVLAALASTVLLPLCLLPSLAPLGTASLVGVFGVFVTGGAMLGRLADGSYAEAGAFVDLAAWQPAFTAAVPGDTPLPDIGSVCVFASLLSNAFLAQYLPASSNPGTQSA